MIPLGNYSLEQTPEEIKAKASAMFRPIARAIKEDPKKAKEIIAPTIKDPEQRAKFEAQLEPLIQEQKKETRKISIPLIVLSSVVVLSGLTFIFLKRRKHEENPHEYDDKYLCGWCRRPTSSISGFCSIECERYYGYCPGCGAPSRGNRQCFECKELGLKNNPFKRKHTGYAHPTFTERLPGLTQWQVEFETVGGSHGTKTYKSYAQAKRAMGELDKRDDIKWSSLRRAS